MKSSRAGGITGIPYFILLNYTPPYSFAPELTTMVKNPGEER